MDLAKALKVCNNLPGRGRRRRNGGWRQPKFRTELFSNGEIRYREHCRRFAAN
jgi:hypothetical protein